MTSNINFPKEIMTGYLEEFVKIFRGLLQQPNQQVLEHEEVVRFLSAVHSADTLRLYLEVLIARCGVIDMVAAAAEIHPQSVQQIVTQLLQTRHLESLVTVINVILTDVELYKTMGLLTPFLIEDFIPAMLELVLACINISTTEIAKEIEAKITAKYEELKVKMAEVLATKGAAEQPRPTSEIDQQWVDAGNTIVSIINEGRKKHEESCSNVKFLGERIGEMEAELQYLRGEYVRMSTNEHHPTQEDWEGVFTALDTLADTVIDTANDLEDSSSNQEGEQEMDECSCCDNKDDDKNGDKEHFECSDNE